MAYKLGETEYTDEQLKAALDSIEKLAKLEQRIAPVLKVAEKYKLDPKDLVENAEGAFHQIFQLQEAGVLDEQGNLVERKEQKSTKTTEPEAKPDQQQNANDVEAIVNKAMEGIAKSVKGLESTVTQLNNSQSQLLRERMSDKVRSKYPHLNDEDISIVLAKATAQKEDFWKLAEERNSEKEKGNQALIESFAKEHKLDLTELNKRKEMSAEGGSVADVILEGKKISRKGGEGTISAKDAMSAYFDAIDNEGV